MAQLDCERIRVQAPYQLLEMGGIKQVVPFAHSPWVAPTGGSNVDAHEPSSVRTVSPWDRLEQKPRQNGGLPKNHQPGCPGWWPRWRTLVVRVVRCCAAPL